MKPKELRRLVREIALETARVEKDPYTMVQLTWQAPDGFAHGGTYTGTGFAKRCPCDKPNRERGIEIAKGRAAAEIVRAIYGP